MRFDDSFMTREWWINRMPVMQKLWKEKQNDFSYSFYSYHVKSFWIFILTSFIAVEIIWENFSNEMKWFNFDDFLYLFSEKCHNMRKVINVSFNRDTKHLTFVIRIFKNKWEKTYLKCLFKWSYKWCLVISTFFFWISRESWEYCSMRYLTLFYESIIVKTY